MHSKLVMALASSLFIASCGGGSGSDNAQASTTLDASNASESKSVIDAPFVASVRSRFIYLTDQVQELGGLDGYTQDAGGAVTKLGSVALTGNPVVVDLSGNASFAMGRWSSGTVATSNGTTELQEANGQTAYYLLYNALAAMPAAGSLTCSAGEFTSTLDAGGTSTSADKLGTASGSAGIVIDATGAHVTLHLSNKVGAESVSAAFTGNIRNVSTGIARGGFFGNTQDAYMALGDAGSGAVRLVTAYQLILSGGRIYRGVATFACN